MDPGVVAGGADIAEASAEDVRAATGPQQCPSLAENAGDSKPTAPNQLLAGAFGTDLLRFRTGTEPERAEVVTPAASGKRRATAA
jgi:hypothetical protein